MNIRILQESDAEAYQTLRLSALLDSPDAFGSTYDREVQFPPEQIRERVRPTTERFVLGTFTDVGLLVGLATFVRQMSPKESHKGNIYGMYVAPEARGRGAGKSLLAELIRRAGEQEGLEQINLTVVASNESAKKLYTSLGFEVYGVERHALKYDGRYFDEYLMALRLNR